jgi:hypothetical protein
MASVVNLDTAKRLDIVCRRGDTFRLELEFIGTDGLAINISGYIWKLDVRETDTSISAILEDNQLDYVATVDGKLTVTIPATTMAAINSGIYVYDIQSESVGIVKTWIYGIFKVNEDITE